MKILAVDDEKIALSGLVEILRKVAPQAEVFGFRDVSGALAFARENEIDAAFMDIEICAGSGLTLARELKKLHPRVNIIFTTGYSEYMGSAFAMHASGYVLKPLTEEKIASELSELRYALADGAKPDPLRPTLRIQAFGNFEVYVGEEPISFLYTRSLELLAYLVDRRGARVSTRELQAVIWEDEGQALDHTSYLKKLRADLISTLEGVGCADIIGRGRGWLSIIKSRVVCDYYDYLKDPSLGTYRGEYMSQYSWSEYTHGILEDMKNGARR